MNNTNLIPTMGWVWVFCVTSLLAQNIALAEEPGLVEFDIEAQALGDALTEFGVQSGKEVYFVSADVAGVQAPKIEGKYSSTDVIEQLLDASGVEYFIDDNGTLLVGTAYAAVAVDERGDSDSKNLAHPKPVLMAQNQDRARARSGEVVEESEEREPVWVEEIIVTGSNIRGIAPDSSPLFVYDRDYIDRTGFNTVEQLIEALPQNFGGGAAADTSATIPTGRDARGNDTRGSSVNLRGLGSGSTLVLLNGSRLAPTGTGMFVDISVIPLSAVERVEVLTDGASAIYGSDAVAGVVNFVLRDDYDGAETLLRYGTVTDGGLDEYKASQTFGKNWSSGNALVVYEYSSQDSLPASDRDFALDAGSPTDFDLLPETERHSLFASFYQDITDRFEVFGNGIYVSRDADFNSNTFGPLFLATDTEQYNFAAGGAIEFGESWHLEVSGTYGQNDSVVSELTLGADEPRLVERENKLWTVDSKIDGALYSLPAGDVRLAAGVGYREEEYSLVLSDFRAERDIVSVYGELFVPVVSDRNRLPGIERLEFSVAGRFEDYSDFGSTTDPKVGVLWSPILDLSLRGTFGTSFKAPNLSDLSTSGLAGFLANVFDPNGLAGTSLLLGLTGGGTGNLGPEESKAWTVGLDYEPEFVPGLTVSVTYYDIEFEDRIEFPSVNAFAPVAEPDVFAPILTFDPSAEEIAAVLAAVPDNFFNFTLFPDLGPPAVPEDAEVIVDNSLQNLAVTNTNGMDFSASYSVETNLGVFGFDFSGTYIFELEQAITPTAPTVDVVDTVFNPADFRFRAGANWSKDGFTASAFVNHTGGYVDDIAVPEADVDSWTTLDFLLSFNTFDRFESAWLDNIRVAFRIQNVFDEDPPTIQGAPVSFVSVGYDPANATPLGRFIAVQISKSW